MNKSKLDRHIIYGVNINEAKHIKGIIKSFNESHDVEYKLTLVPEITKVTGIDFGTCRICGKPIIYNHTDLYFFEDRELSTVNARVYWAAINHPADYKRVLECKEYSLSCCEKCLRDAFPDNFPKTNTLIFSKGQRWSAFVYNVPEDVAERIRKNTVAVTKEAMIRKWGEEEGIKHWEHYCKLQSKTNTFEYKQEKYGWTKEEFDEYNKKRAVTLENLISKYGDKLGREKWKTYLKKQHITKSYDYMIEKFGKEKADEINNSKALTLDNFIKKYGDIEGKIKYDEFLKQFHTYYSTMSQKFFDSIDSFISKKYETYYATKNYEQGFSFSCNRYVKLDYFIKELNLCVEFNGDCFHGNPAVFKDTDKPHPYLKNLTALQLQKRDAKRYKKLNDLYGIKTIVVWERDYRNGIDIEDFIKNTLKIEI